MRTALAGLLAVCLAVACDGSAVSPDAAADPHGVPFLALGDSYTIGHGVAEADRWPVQLVKRLRARGVDAGDPTVIARTGWTTDELSAAIDEARPQGPFGLVTLLIGVNDQFRGGTPDAYRPKLGALLDRSIALTGWQPRRVLVLSIPDWGVMPFANGYDHAAIGKSIDAFNAVGRDECVKRGITFVDVTPASREAATQPALAASDGLHPSGAQYAHWARLADEARRSAGQ
ncbi:MAG TPA: SGNH/GDSL hydrolase family protein [Tepidisphaeraceae bacterium]|jgi:lysophospholipase L1-like esterase